MRSNLFKLSAVAATIVASFGANAALYNVYEYLPADTQAKTYGVAIQPSTADCWGAIDCSTTHTTDEKIAFEEQRYNQGFDYRDEAPFRYTAGFDYLEDNLTGFDSYCNNYLKYNETACDSWASEQFTNGYEQELNGINNSLAYIESNADRVYSAKNNVIVNSFASASGDAMGTYYDGDLAKRSIAYEGGTLFDTTGYTQSKVWSKDGTYSVGSVGKLYSGNDYTSNAVIWDGTSIHKVIGNDSTASGRSIAQGSARDIAKVLSTVYAVGYSSDGDRRPVASVFLLDGTKKLVTSYSDSAYLNSLFTHINSNGIAIGERKHATGVDGSLANQLFYITDPANPNGTVHDFSGGIFFSGANGKAGAINDHNEVVGQIDYQKHNEIGGGPRAKRAFVTTIGNVSTSPLKGQSRYLDDLTMGSNAGALATNNQYRIIDATDINDAGVISGTAYFCSSGYDSESINSTCNGGTPGVEKIVAVKLVPIQGATSSDIQTRPVDVTKIDRQGGSLGWLALSLLALLGFRRKQ
ncbi:DUF3466 family protein [Vibrio kasasachensis]|uniref:DUF3466 family protein n=1 Tax=Vibrio kasasachensis TaxID=2910248 RepID=UPI003D1406CA